MYYPIGWHKVLNVDTQCNQEQCNIISVQANHERELFFILTPRSIHIWNPKPLVEIICHRRSNESVDSIGLNRTAVWKIDSSVIVVATDRDQLLFYQLRRRNSSSSTTTFLLSGSSNSDSIYRLRHDSKNVKNLLWREPGKTSTSILSLTDSIPALTIFSFGKLDLSAIGVSCLMSAEEEIIVGARNGNIYGVHWNGSVDNKFPWSLSKEARKDSGHIIDIKFSSILSGFALVFSSGKVCFMPLRSEQKKSINGDIRRNESQVSFLPEINDAICADVNHRYRLVAFGLKSSKVVVCSVDDNNATLIINHRLELQNSKYPHDVSQLGGIRCLKYSPDNFALVTSWEGGNFAIWSVFGSLLFCSQQWQSSSQATNQVKPITISTLDWGREGYSLWMCVDRADFDDCESLLDSSISTANGFTSSNENRETDEIIVISIAHSALPASPHLTCSSDAIILVSEERLYVGPSEPHKDKFDHWVLVDIPQIYLNENHPIRYATVDRECKNLAVAGNTGFAVHSLESSRWRFFNKKMHENGFSICGDMIWWKDYLVLSCFNLESESFEIRAYQSNEALSNDNCVTQTTPMEITRLSIFENRLLVLYIDGTLGMFMLNLRRKPTFKKPKPRLMRSDSFSNAKTSLSDYPLNPSPKSSRSDSVMSLKHAIKKESLFKDIVLQISPIENLVISNLQANANCILSIALTRLHFKNNRSDDSILLNACGKLFLLEREVPPDLSMPLPSSDPLSVDLNNLSLDTNKSSEIDHKVNSAIRLSNSIHLAAASLKSSPISSALSNVTFKAVSVIATNVEQFWISPEISNASDMSYFKKSLWLSCGGPNNYLQVWLPLLNDKSDPPTDLYVPDRIMLPIKCDIYPLAIRSSAPDVVEPDDAIVLGAESDILYRDSRLFTLFPYGTVKRQCRVYLHRILRELLLNQHLGYYARKIAESCQSLPYFAHCFELLLHEVLEEEATSPVPLPDPMLPQIVRFIKEFPVYLETVVHCARKSELSMWSYLFDERAVGNPRRLFQECLEKHKLATAASCLIILQSLDRNIVSQRMVKELIRAARDDPEHNYLIQDLENFLSRAEIDYSNVSGSGSPSL